MIIIAINCFINISYDFRNGLDSDINLGPNNCTSVLIVIHQSHRDPQFDYGHDFVLLGHDRTLY